MIYKKLSRKLASFNLKYISFKNYSSALYITGDKAQKTFAVLTPVIDFDKQLENKDDLINNLKARHLLTDIENIEKRWQFFKFVDENKQTLEAKRAEISQAVAYLLKNNSENEEEINKLKLHAKIVKDDLKNVKDHYYEIEEVTMMEILRLPNILHKKTPYDKSIVIHEYVDKITEKSEHHIIIGEKKGYIKYLNQFVCFLKSDAALFEMSTLNYFRNCLLECGYNHFSSPNFCRSVVAEGCGETLENITKMFTLQEEQVDLNRLHLCGGASLYSFMAYFTKHLIQQTNLPLKLFSLGKKYELVSPDVLQSLFNLSQQAVINIFVATLEEEDVLESLVEEIITFYEPLGHHFRLVFLPAHELEKSESFRLSIEMYSNYKQCYIEVGDISGFDSYISKRLLFTYNVDKQRKYPKVISGTLLNVPKLLGCVLENNSLSKSSLVSDFLKNHLFS